MEGGGLIHELRDFVDNKKNVRVCKREILESANKASLGGWISERMLRISGEKEKCVCRGHVGFYRLDFNQVAFAEKIENAVLLRKNEIIRYRNSFLARKKWRRPKSLMSKSACRLQRR